MLWRWAQTCLQPSDLVQFAVRFLLEGQHFPLEGFEPLLEKKAWLIPGWPKNRGISQTHGACFSVGMAVGYVSKARGANKIALAVDMSFPAATARGVFWEGLGGTECRVALLGRGGRCLGPFILFKTNFCVPFRKVRGGWGVGGGGVGSFRVLGFVSFWAVLKGCSRCRPFSVAGLEGHLQAEVSGLFWDWEGGARRCDPGPSTQRASTPLVNCSL